MRLEESQARVVSLVGRERCFQRTLPSLTLEPSARPLLVPSYPPQPILTGAATRPSDCCGSRLICTGLGSLESAAWQQLSCWSLSWRRQQLRATGICDHLSERSPPSPACPSGTFLSHGLGDRALLGVGGLGRGGEQEALSEFYRISTTLLWQAGCCLHHGGSDPCVPCNKVLLAAL